MNLRHLLACDTVAIYLQKDLLQIASQLSNRLKHSNVRERADLGTEERKKNWYYIFPYMQ